jgi:hypothetical protein
MWLPDWLYKTRHHQHTVRERWLRRYRTGLKCAAISFIPALMGTLAGLIWHFAFFKANFHLEEKMEVISTAAWIPAFALLYGFFTSPLLTKVWDEYKEMRKAVKKNDLDAFLDLRDEEQSPLMYGLVILTSLMLIGAFAGVQYPRAIDGWVVISSMSYLLTLIFCVIMELDDPCAGIWFIRSIPEEWLKINVRQYREARRQKSPEPSPQRMNGKPHVIVEDVYLTSSFYNFNKRT